MRSQFHFAAAFCVACAVLAAAPVHAADDPATAARTESPADAAPAVLSAEDWRARTRIDLAAFAEAVRQNYIYAAYPDPAGWSAWFEPALATVEAGIPLVNDEAGYQAVLTHMAAIFQDRHVYVQFEPSTGITSRWPGFLARYDDGTYRITAPKLAGIADGDEVSACDGKPMSWWVATIAELEIGVPDTLETTRNIAALRLFVDRGNPLRPRPAECVIGGRSVTLDWAPAPTDEINPVIVALRGFGEPEVSTQLIGDDGAWVKLGYFDASNAEQAEALHTAIRAAPSLRDKRFIVLDVRGNGGGPYNWFMGYLRGLYGQAYADHYATVRLNIQAVYRLSPAYVELDRAYMAMANDLGEPADPPYEINDAENERLQKEAIAAGAPIYVSQPLPFPPAAPAPPNPVSAQVYVLTNHACASACIGFVDELKQFPGVRQIGHSTSVDSRSGTAVEIGLPSGKATANIAAMTRDGRLRDDNEPQLPSIRYAGVISDDEAVEAWILQEVVGR